MTQTYAEARAAQLAWLLPRLHAEHDRLMNLRESTMSGAALHDRGVAVLCRQADAIEADIAGLR